MHAEFPGRRFIDRHASTFRGQRWLHFAYRLGAAADALAALALLSPAVAARAYDLADFDPGPAYQFAAGIAAALMLGWTALLVWADRRPFERRGILLLTVCPVLVCLAAAEVWLVSVGFIRPAAMAPTWALQAGLAVMYLMTYWRTSTLEDGATRV